jgi:ATP-dependent RNA helicase DeaD
MRAVEEIGYEQPSPIQSQSIPPLLAGRDLIGMAQTGTGKTAAFALPLLSRVDLANAVPQVLVLAPTRELAIQVSEAFQRYASRMEGFHVVPIYGGQEYSGQLRQLRRGVHVVVGTPGRVMDHLRRGSLVLDSLRTLVLDEADEMLRMGFLDDVEWILRHTPDTRQTALFSATMPPQIRKVAETYLRDPCEVSIVEATITVKDTEQHACLVHAGDKLDALTRLLETAEFDGVLVFVRTKTATVELAGRVEARGFACTPLNGDMDQKSRERTIGRFRAGALDVLIATDVAARGLDVPRISHVINFDVPHDAEAYIHRVGRTGRAGRGGTAITFVTARERRLLHSIERATRSPMKWLEVPGQEQLAERRIGAFKQQMKDILAGNEELDFFRELIRDFAAENTCSTEDAAAALAFQLQRERPLQPPPDKGRQRKPSLSGDRDGANTRFQRGRTSSTQRADDSQLERYTFQVGREHGVGAGHIVGAITGEAGLDGSEIGRIKLNAKAGTVDLPLGLSSEILQRLEHVRVLQQPLELRRTGGRSEELRPERPHSDRPAPFRTTKTFGGKAKPWNKNRSKRVTGTPGTWDKTRLRKPEEKTGSGDATKPWNAVTHAEPGDKKKPWMLGSKVELRNKKKTGSTGGKGQAGEKRRKTTAAKPWEKMKKGFGGKVTASAKPIRSKKPSDG